MAATPFKQRLVTVTAEDGESVPAVLMGCTCGGEKFFAYIILGDHQHLQCTTCGTSYCDGACEEPSPSPADRGRPLDPRD